MLNRVNKRLSAAFGVCGLAALSAAGTAVARAAHMPIPGPVVGLVGLLMMLGVLGRVPRGLRLASELLIRHLNLFYIPAAVGVMAHVGLLRADVAAILLALLPGTWIALGAAAAMFRTASRRQGGR